MLDDVAKSYLRCLADGRPRRALTSGSMRLEIAITDNKEARTVCFANKPGQTTAQPKTVLLDNDDNLACLVQLIFREKSLWIERVDRVERLFESRNFAGLIILDRQSVDREAVSVIVRLRSNGDRTPIVVISSLDSVSDRIDCLYAGADDYLVKPFAIEELVARAISIRRRCEAHNFQYLVAGSLRLDRVERAAYRAGREIKLLPREFKLLEFLLQNADDVMTRNTI